MTSNHNFQLQDDFAEDDLEPDGNQVTGGTNRLLSKSTFNRRDRNNQTYCESNCIELSCFKLNK